MIVRVRPRATDSTQPCEWDAFTSAVQQYVQAHGYPQAAPHDTDVVMDVLAVAMDNVLHDSRFSALAPAQLVELIVMLHDWYSNGHFTLVQLRHALLSNAVCRAQPGGKTLAHVVLYAKGNAPELRPHVHERTELAVIGHVEWAKPPPQGPFNPVTLLKRTWCAEARSKNLNPSPLPP